LLTQEDVFVILFYEGENFDVMGNFEPIIRKLLKIEMNSLPWSL